MKRCTDCRTEFDSPQEYLYKNGWKLRPVCRDSEICDLRKKHTLSICRVITKYGVIFTCGFVGCGFSSHLVQATLAGGRLE